MSQRKGMNSIKKTLFLFTYLNIAILHSLSTNNDNQTPSSRLFYETPNCFASFFTLNFLWSDIFHLCTRSSGNIAVSYLLTPWCRVLLEKLTGLQLVKKFPAFYGTRRSITALTSVRHLSLSWARPIHSTYPHPTSWRSILILSTHLLLGLLSGLFPSGFPTKTLYAPLSSSIRATCPAHNIAVSN